METQPDGTSSRYTSTGALKYQANPGGGRWTVVYGGGLAVAVADPAGRRTTIAYDGSSKIRRIQEPGGRVTSFTVDGSGNLVRWQRPDGTRVSVWVRRQPPADGLGSAARVVRTTFGYDPTTGQVVQAVSPLAMRTTYAYRLAGRRSSRPGRGRTTLTFDANNRLVNVRSAAGLRTTTTWTNGLPATVGDDGRGSTALAYTTLADNTPRLTTMTLPGPLGQPATVADDLRRVWPGPAGHRRPGERDDPDLGRGLPAQRRHRRPREPDDLPVHPDGAGAGNHQPARPADDARVRQPGPGTSRRQRGRATDDAPRSTPTARWWGSGTRWATGRRSSGTS